MSKEGNFVQKSCCLLKTEGYRLFCTCQGKASGFPTQASQQNAFWETEQAWDCELFLFPHISLALPVLLQSACLAVFRTGYLVS